MISWLLKVKIKVNKFKPNDLNKKNIILHQKNHVCDVFRDLTYSTKNNDLKIHS